MAYLLQYVLQRVAYLVLTMVCLQCSPREGLEITKLPLYHRIVSVGLKGKLAHNFMTSYLVFISCLLDIIKKSTTEKKRKNNNICSYRGKQIKFGIPYILGFQISALATSLKREFPLNEKECLCVIIRCLLNQIT